MQTRKEIAILNNVAGNTAFGVFYTMFLKQSWKLVLENPALLESARIILFPFIILTDVVRMALSWYDAKQKNYEGAPLIRAIHDTVSTITAATAVALGFTIGAIYATLAPTIFTVLLGFNSLVHLASSIYYGVQGNKQARNDHLAASITLGLSSAAVATLTFVGNTFFAIIGIVGAALGVAYALYKGYKEYKAAQAQQLEAIVQPQNEENQSEDNQNEALLTFNAEAEPTNQDTQKLVPTSEVQETDKLIEASTPEVYLDMPPSIGITINEASALTGYHGSLINNMSPKNSGVNLQSEKTLQNVSVTMKVS